MSELLQRIRQWTYPPAFRVESGDSTVGFLTMELAAINDVLAGLSAPVEQLPQSRTDPTDPSVLTTSKIDKELAAIICTQMVRLERATKTVMQQGVSEANRIKDQLDRMRETLKGIGAIYEDFTGQAYDPGRLDFEPLGELQYRPDLKYDTIINCERPMVMLNGKLIQKAKGIVGTPKH